MTKMARKTSVLAHQIDLKHTGTLIDLYQAIRCVGCEVPRVRESGPEVEFFDFDPSQFHGFDTDLNSNAQVCRSNVLFFKHNFSFYVA